MVAPGSYGVPCKFFKYGDCSNGDRCPYLHATKKEKKEEHKDKAATDGTSTPEKQTDEEEKLSSPVGNAEVDADKEKAPVDEAAKNELDETDDVTELKDFISKEEGWFTRCSAVVVHVIDIHDFFPF
ncbi:unnamed protein product [Phytophthora lilii]|uniref:Unnamed protein product n=1 Tax=Phytophthora lilii TaxID=2077276 RepID=A0A9W6TYF6_9STRA|nr:unnamed protein product [Phytophthora lilii]